MSYRRNIDSPFPMERHKHPLIESLKTAAMERALYLLIGQQVAVAGRNLIGVYKGLGRRYFDKGFGLDVVIREKDKISIFLACPLVEGLTLADVQDPFVQQLISNTIESVINNIDTTLDRRGSLDSNRVDYVDDRYVLYMEIVYSDISEHAIRNVIESNETLIKQLSQDS